MSFCRQVLPQIIQPLVDKYGWRWSLRIQCFIAAVSVGFAVLVYRRVRKPTSMLQNSTSTGSFHLRHRSYRELLKDRLTLTLVSAFVVVQLGFDLMRPFFSPELTSIKFDVVFLS